jgi:type I restriction enzyme S subunit
MKSFDEIFVDKTKYGVKVQTTEYSEVGEHIIIDQGQSQIAGYTDRQEGLFEEVPVVIFGDHTRVIKYVDEPFFLGADGVKVLRSKDDNANYKYLYYALKNARIPDTGYNRHFKWLKEVQINYPDSDKQAEIVDILDNVSSVIKKREDELCVLDDLIKARFVELFGDPRSNPFGFEKKMLKDTCKVITGNTPSRAIAEYYGDYIEWIKTDNIVSGILSPTQATESLSEKGMNVGRTVEKNSILMACIAGSIASIGRVCITDRTVAFNQQINAVVPEQYNILFLYVLLQMSKDYLVEDINMALKGILSKSKLEEKEFIIPPMDLQEQFSDFVKQVDKSKVVVASVR